MFMTPICKCSENYMYAAVVYVLKAQNKKIPFLIPTLLCIAANYLGNLLMECSKDTCLSLELPFLYIFGKSVDIFLVVLAIIFP